MLNISEDDLKKAIVQKASDEILRQDDDLTSMIREEVKARIDRIFVDRAQAQVSAAIDDAIRDGFEREYQRVNPWGTPEGEKTSIRKELDKVVTGYWSARVNTRTGKPENSDYNTITRAEYLMTQICAEDFSKGMKDAVIAVTGGLKDGLRKQLATHMDGMLDKLFHIRSLQDQGKVEEPW